MSNTATIVWLHTDEQDSIPNELRSHIAVFTNEDACFQFLHSLPTTSNNLTLAVTDPQLLTNRLIELKSISTIYILISSTSDTFKKASPKIDAVFNDRQSLLDQIQTDLIQRKSPSPNFITGILAPFQGLYFILTHSATWLRALIPAIAFIVLFVVCCVPSIWGLHIATDRLIHKYFSRWKHVAIWILRILLYIVAVCLSLIIAMITAQPVSSPALESLVRAQERALKYPNRPEESFCSSVWRSTRIAVISLLISLAIFILLTFIELFIPPVIIVTTPVKFLVTAMILAYDIIDYPLSLHMLGVRERTPWFRHNLWAALGFGLAMEGLFLIPGACLLLLPAAVCGATRLVVAAERASIDQPLLLQHDVI
jgi:CysZ protein